MYRSHQYKAAALLRFGLAFVFLYAAARALQNPTAWVGFVPDRVENFGFTRERALFATSILEIALGLLLVINFKPKFLALISFVLMVAITISAGLVSLDVTFRDIGLAFASLALFVAAP